jgi:hypothetical protein
VEVIRASNAGLVLDFNGQDEVQNLESDFPDFFKSWTQFAQEFKPNMVDQTVFDMYSARSVTATLAALLNSIFQSPK